MPKTQILIVSYAKDLPYLRYNLESIDKFATGFAGVTLVVPSTESSDFASLAAGHNAELKTYERVPDQKKWHLHAQCQKCFADKHCPDADFILHTDSDCIFTEPVTPEDYFENGLPIMLIEKYDRLPNSPWRAVTEAVLRQRVDYETMRRHPQVNPRKIYHLLRLHLTWLHEMPFEQYVLSRKPDFVWGFSEHNAIGAFALRDWPYLYRWIDAGKEPWPHEKLRQFWSYSPVDKEQASPHGEPPTVPIKVIEEILSK